MQNQITLTITYGVCKNTELMDCAKWRKAGGGFAIHGASLPRYFFKGGDGIVHSRIFFVLILNLKK